MFSKLHWLLPQTCPWITKTRQGRLITDPPPSSSTILSKNVTTDTWHLTPDTWHLTPDTRWNDVLKVLMKRITDWLTDSMNEWRSNKGVCRAAQATPGLLIKGYAWWFVQYCESKGEEKNLSSTNVLALFTVSGSTKRFGYKYFLSAIFQEFTWFNGTHLKQFYFV